MFIEVSMNKTVTELPIQESRQRKNCACVFIIRILKTELSSQKKKKKKFKFGLCMK